MLKNIFRLMLFVVVIVTFLSVNNYVNGEVQPQSNAQNFSAQDIYYKENPWDFVENYLMMYPGKTERWFFLVDFVIFVASLQSGLLSSFGIEAAFEKIFNTKIKNNSSGILIGTMAAVGAIGGIVAAVAFHLYMSSPTMRYENLISILKRYDPDLNNTSSKNTKLYVPKQLHSLFDTLWMVYKERGEKFLKAEWDKVAEKIMNKIKYEIKPMKYREMTVRVVY